MRFKAVGNKADSVITVVRSAESSSTIPAGSPVCFVMNGTDDGLGVVLPNTGTATKATSLFAGVSLEAIAAGKFGECVAFGVHTGAVVVRATRSASGTDAAWASQAAIAIGDVLNVDTVANGLTKSTAGAAQTGLALAVALATKASAASTAATDVASTLTLTASTVSLKVFVRAL